MMNVKKALILTFFLIFIGFTKAHAAPGALPVWIFPTYTPVGTLTPIPTSTPSNVNIVGGGGGGSAPTVFPTLYIVIPNASPTPTPNLTPTGSNANNVWVQNAATPNATISSGKDVQLTQVTQLYGLQTQVAQLQTVVNIAPVGTQTPTATPNPTQVPLMVATMQAQINLMLTAIPIPTVNVNVSFGAATATPNPTQGPSMLATIQAQLNAISTAIPVPTVNVSVSGIASTPVPAQTLTAVTIVFSPTPQTAVIVPTPTGGSGINYVYRLRILQPGVSNPIQVGLTSNATPIPGAGGITNEIDDLTFSSWYASQNGKDISATANAGGTVIFDLWTSPNPWTGH